jgi:hypothetical protein
MEAALRKAGSKDFTVQIMPGLKKPCRPARWTP